MAKHIRPGLGEITYFFCPLGRAFPRWIPTPMWLDKLVMIADTAKAQRIGRWLNMRWIVRGKTVLYD